MSCLQDDKDAFYVADLGDVLKKHLRWARAMPRVQPFYAVKCNDGMAVVRTLASLGAGFDCASKVHPRFLATTEFLYKALWGLLVEKWKRFRSEAIWQIHVFLLFKL